MGGKSSPPPPPDYTGAAQAQAGASKEITNMQTWANRPTQNTPWGSTTWNANATVDPASGQTVTAWTQNTSLAPQLQGALNDQLELQAGRSDLANSFMGRVANEYSQPFSYGNLPSMAQAQGPGQLQTDARNYSQDLAAGFNFGAPLPQVDSSFRDNVANQLMTRMQPVHDYQQRQLETKLANQGFTQGSEAYNRALTELNQRQAGERFNALDNAGSEAQRLYNMQMGTAQQGYNQNLQAAQFRNQALGQASALDLANMQAGNQAMSQQYGLNQQFADAQNRLRQQAIAEQMQRRGMSLNEMNALLSGQQVAMPTMPSFSAASKAETPNLLGAMQMGYDAQLGAYNADQAAFGNLLGAGAQLGGAVLSNPAFAFSDARLKRNVRRVGTHSIGVGIYDYTMMGVAQRGVIAQEVAKVRPDLVKRHANGYLMVNYGGL
jgi:hypothetical protein